MTLRHLNIFIAVCECGSVTKAAEYLHMAQPAISTAIAEMEKYYDVVLFERINQRLHITDTGRELLLKARAVVSSFADFEERAYEGRDDPSVRIGSTLTIGKTVIPQILGRLRREHPEIQPYIKICKAAAVEDALLSGEIDFGLIEGEISSPHLFRVSFGSDRLIVVAGVDFPIAASVSVTELSKYPLLVREPGSASRDLLEHTLTERRLPFRPLMESQSNEAILAAVRENAGIAALPYSLVQRDLASGALREISVDGISFERDFHLVRHKNKRFTHAQEIVWNLCSR